MKFWADKMDLKIDGAYIDLNNFGFIVSTCQKNRRPLIQFYLKMTKKQNLVWNRRKHF